MIIATLMVPGQVTMIPLFLVFKTLGWLDTLLPLIVPHFFLQPFFIFLLRQFFMTIPKELDEAARIDGASEWQIFSGVVLPLAKPVLATVGLFTFLKTWNDFLGPLVYLSSQENYTLSLGLGTVPRTVHLLVGTDDGGDSGDDRSGGPGVLLHPTHVHPGHHAHRH